MRRSRIGLGVSLCLMTLSVEAMAARAGSIKEVRVRNREELRQAITGAKSGTRILLQPGEYQGDIYLSKVHGTAAQPIVITAADKNNPPRIVGGGNSFHFAEVSYLELNDLILSKTTDNGLNLDDGGIYEKPSHHITLRNVRVSDVGPQGNRDGIKLSGIDDFRLENCIVERWGSGGSAIDMVGCHRGVITGCTFRQGGDDGVQTKGGSSGIWIQNCRFENYGGRGVNIGGSTGMEFFRPPIKTMPPNGKYEAKNIRIEGCTFNGGGAPLAFVGVDGAVARYNTIYHPERWAIRILQETQEPGFIACRNGVLEDNLIVFRSDHWYEGGVNIGPKTEPRTFRFARNFWYCSDRPENSRPNLPYPENDPVTGRDPSLRDPSKGDLRVQPGSPAQNHGAHALPASSRK